MIILVLFTLFTKSGFVHFKPKVEECKPCLFQLEIENDAISVDLIKLMFHKEICGSYMISYTVCDDYTVCGECICLNCKSGKPNL